MFAFFKLVEYWTFINWKLILADTKASLIIFLEKYRLNCKSVLLCSFLYRVKSEDLINNGLEWRWVKGTWLYSMIFLSFLEPKNLVCSCLPIWIVKSPLLTTEGCLDFVETIVSRRIVQANSSELERILFNIKFFQVRRKVILNHLTHRFFLG